MSLKGFTMKYGRVTTLLFGINVLVYIFEAVLSGNPIDISIEVLARLGQWNYAVINGAWWQLLTAMFVHVGILHIAFNMYFLLMLGSQLERLFGGRVLVFTYLVAGLVGNLVTLFLLPPNSVSAGASGALFGIVGLLIMTSGIIGGNIGRALTNAFVLFLINSLFPGVNAFAHLGGLITGILLGLYYGKKLRRKLMAMTYGYAW
ncbi:rhomboid family intramembrane serine protease [Thermococcus sp. CX2]|uniref:rhomboid family intramembrane serine protease n=1 Tax=Thermococcus sp. CX2 TaxID=163006 RepID=UPI00143975C7|nr:rhomboid family intramembrane serine protease [Thermococcus sp. CX2]NJE85747.1 rhomboid family intramembrane serine protease [Thermococcus sp. CX2]